MKEVTIAGFPVPLADIDECAKPSTSTCDIATTVCKNSAWSHSCDCKTGFFRIDGNTCLGPNPCEFYFIRYNLPVDFIKLALLSDICQYSSVRVEV